MWLFLLFLAIPLIEIALFIQIGGLIGLGWTLVIVILTALLGTFLVRQQGALALNQLRNSFSQLDDPAEPLAHGAMILLAGALLLTPGFFTDACGFALLMPPVRMALFQFLRNRIEVTSFQMGPNEDEKPHQSDTIETEYYEIKPEASNKPGTSGWTKH